jgi:hypothetical protein
MRSVPPSATLTPSTRRMQRNTGSGLSVPHLGDLGALRVMRSVQTLAVTLTPRAQRSQRTAWEEQGSGSDVLRSPWRSWRAWRDERPVSRQERKGRKELHGRNRVRNLMFFGPLGDLGALGVMRSIQTLAATLTPRAQRAQRTAWEEQGSGSDVLRSSWRSWRAWRDAVNPNPRSNSHAKSAKDAKNCMGGTGFGT